MVRRMMRFIDVSRAQAQASGSKPYHSLASQEVPMSPRLARWFLAAILGLSASASGVAQQAAPKPGGYIVQHDNEVAANEPGPHQGGGATVGHSFFRNTPNLKLVFRKRVLKPGSGIGYHVQQEDEIYYVLSGRGVM